MNMHVSMDGPMDQSNHFLWNITLAECEAARQALEHHNSTVYHPLEEEIERISRPSLYFEIEALSGQVARYNLDATDLHAWDDHWSPVYRRKAAEARDAWLTYRSNCKQLGSDAAGQESDRLCNVQCAIESRLIQMPAPDRAALRWKLEHLFGPEARDDGDYAPAWCAEWMNVVMDDVRRLLAEDAKSEAGWSARESIAA